MSEEIADALINSPSRWAGLWLGLGSAGKRFIVFLVGGPTPLGMWDLSSLTWN